MGGGGHHGGGGGHHGGHGGGFVPSFAYGYGYPAYGYTDIVVREGCPDAYQPVLAADGRVYRNACYAMLAGAQVVKSVKGGTAPLADVTLPIIGTISTPAAIVGAAGLYLIYRHFKKRRT